MEARPAAGRERKLEGRVLELHLEGLKLDGVDALEPLSLQLQVRAPGPACRLAAAYRESSLVACADLPPSSALTWPAYRSSCEAIIWICYTDGNASSLRPRRIKMLPVAD